MKAECEHGLDTRLPCGDCQKAYEAENAPSLDSSPSACYDGNRHHWKDGWMCERCGMRRADYEDMKRHNESGEGRPRAAEKDDGHGQQA